jgi:hypothetical protein
VSRRRRARLWIRWTLRDARRHRAQVLSIALLLALGIGMYAAMSSMSIWRVQSADASFAALRMHDLRVALVGTGTVRTGALRAALTDSGASGDVAAARERLVVATQVDASRRGATVIVPGRIVGTAPGGGVDQIALRGGAAPSEAAGEQAQVALEHNFARHYDLPASGTLTLAGGRRVTYSGQALAPEYLVVTAPGADFGAESAFAVVFASLRTAQTLAGLPDRVNELVLRLRPGADVNRVRARLSAALHGALPGTGVTFTPRDREPAHRLIYKDAEGDGQMLDIFSFLLLGAATFAAFNLVSRTVEAQRREIGIGMALGVPPRALARRPVLLSAQIALGGVVLGVPIGLAADAWLAGIMDEFFPLPVVHTGFQTGVYARGAALGLALPLLAAALPVWRALRVPPHPGDPSGGTGGSRQWAGVAAQGPPRARRLAGEPPAAQRAAHPAPHAHDGPGDRGGRDDRDRARRPHELLRHHTRRQPAGGAGRIGAAPDRRSHRATRRGRRGGPARHGRRRRGCEPALPAPALHARSAGCATRRHARGHRRRAPRLASDAAGRDAPHRRPRAGDRPPCRAGAARGRR